MTRHLVVATIVSGLATALVVVLALRYDEPRTARNFTLAGLAVIAVVAGLSVTSNTLIRPCLDDPARDCAYNDSVSSMAVVLGVYALVCCIRAWFVYSER